MNLESRQFGGFYNRGPPRRLRRALTDSSVVVAARTADDDNWVGRLISADERVGRFKSMERLGDWSRCQPFSKVKRLLEMTLPNNDTAKAESRF
jgi:hypothetical protein